MLWGWGGEGESPSMLAMTVVTSKLQASAAIMTPPGKPSTKKLDNTWGDTPLQMASQTEALFPVFLHYAFAVTLHALVLTAPLPPDLAPPAPDHEHPA